MSKRSSNRRRTPGYRRTAVVGLASVGFVIAGLSPANGAPAEPSAPAQEAFSNGTAKAVASSVKIAPGVGSLELALKSGVAVSEIRNQLAQAESQPLDLGLVGSTLTAESCSGGSPVVEPEQLPQPIRVDNRQGDAEATQDMVPVAGSSLAAGHGEVRANQTPKSQAVATSLTSVTPLLELNGGKATATTEIIDGAARQAHAQVAVDLSIAGVVNLGGMSWDALHRTGANPEVRGSFTLGTAVIPGANVPTENLKAVEDAANTALAPTGIKLEFPRIERFEQPADLVRVTPLRISISDSQVGGTVLSPILTAIQPIRSEIFNQLAAVVCQSAGALLVGDVVVSVASGTGFIRFEIGGAEATTGELVLSNPFGAAITPSGNGGVLPSSGVATPSTGGGPIGSSLGATPVVGAPAGGGIGAPSLTKPVADVGPLKELCETIHPGRAPSCSEGAMLPLGAAGLVATFAIGGLDWFQQRRRLAALEVLA